MDDYKEILNSLNTPLLPDKPISNSHKIFTKYTSYPYYKYAFDLLETLCNKTNYDNKKRLLHMAFTYLTIILYNCENVPYVSNFDMMILCCFNLSIKVIENQKSIPCINKLKKIYKEKYANYQKEEIVKVELICVKLLNYKINIITVYDYLYYLLSNNNKNSLESATKELETQIINNIQDNIKKNPLDLAKEIINNINKNKYSNLLLRKKIIPVFHCVNITKNDKNEKTEKSIEKNDIRDNNINSNNNFDSNSSYTKITIANNMSNISKKNSPIYSHQNNKVSIISHNSKNKSNLHNHPISLVLHNPLNSHEKNKAKKELPRNIMINSFTNLDIELNNSPVNRTNCDSSSPNGSDGLSSFIILNNSGINLTKNSSSGNVFKKPCIDKKNIKTFFTNNKKKLTSNNLESNIDISQENIFYENSPENLKSEQLSNNFFSNTVYLSQMNEYSKSKDKNRTIKVD